MRGKWTSFEMEGGRDAGKQKIDEVGKVKISFEAIANPSLAG